MPVSINGTTGYAGPLGSLTVDSTALQANAVTTAKIADANVTVAKLSATGTPSSSTFLRGDGTWNAPGGVTSAVAGNGIAVSGATGAVTFSAAAPSFNSVGSYAYVAVMGTNTVINSGASLSAGGGINQVMSASSIGGATNNLSGTWRWMGNTLALNTCQIYGGIACRIS